MAIDLSTVSLPFDRSGTAASNKIGPKRYTLNSPGWSGYNIIIPEYAPFFGESIDHLVHYPSGRILQRGVDWIEGWYFQSASGEIGKNIYSCIYLYDPTLTGDIEIPSYQALGGEWQLNVTQLTYILANTLLNPLRYYWEVVSNMPSIFPPLDHDQDIQDFTTLGNLIDALGTIEQAIRDAAAGTTTSVFQAHLSDTNNPHGVNKLQLALEKVMNYAMATAADVDLAVLNPETYLNPPVAKLLIDSIVGPQLNAHVNNRLNPHGVDAHQTGGYFTAEVDALLQNLAAGLLHNVYAYRLEGKSVADILAMAQSGSSTDLSTLQTALNTVQNDLAIHLQDVANPHEVDAHQTGSYFTTEIDALLVSLAAGQLHDVYAYRLNDRSSDDIITLASTDALNKVAQSYATLTGLQTVTTAMNSLSQAVGNNTSRIQTLEQAALLISSTATIPANGLFTFDMWGILADPADAPLFDFLGAEIQVTMLDEVAGSVTNGSYIGSEAVVTLANRAAQYLDLYNQGSTPITVQIRGRVNRI